MDKEKKAYWKGYNDEKGSKKRGGGLGELIDPSYRPSKEHQEAYKAGWDRAKKEKESSGTCFISTACMEAMGLPDNCAELETLRNFRDEYLAKDNEGRRIIGEYYKIAPNIVEEIKRRSNKHEIFSTIFRDINKIISFIHAENPELAIKRYKEMVVQLEKKYL